MKRVFISDCEGPISKNDNAFELTKHFVPDGDKLFSRISQYDDILADIVKKRGYTAGSTLKLVLPFLRAYDVTDKLMQEFSTRSLFLIAGIPKTLKYIRAKTEVFIVSTSYEHYIKALCNAVLFPFEHTYCTRLKIDKYLITDGERTRLKILKKEIAQMQPIKVSPSAKDLENLQKQDQAKVKRLDEIFWSELAEMSCGKIFSEVTTVGGEQKAESIRDVTTKLGIQLSDVMYVGDSITDVEAFQLIRENGGLAISFNGNNYAVKNADVCVLSENSVVTTILADVFIKHGKEQVLKVVENWNHVSLKYSTIDSALLDWLFEVYPKVLPKIQIVTPQNMESLTKQSSDFRKRVRGETVGKLG